VEPHDRGAVLVATIFDAFQRVYNYRTRDLLRIASSGTGVLPEGSINRDLLHRLAEEASQIAEHLLHICIRALDYCPPTDILFGSYLRALITADLDIAPEDENGYRLALIEAFRARGIFPQRVNTLSIESLRWNKPDFTTTETRAFNSLADQLKEDIHGLVESRDRFELYRRSMNAQKKLNKLLMGDFPGDSDWENFFKKLSESEWENFLNKLGLTSRPVSQLFGNDSSKVRFLRRGRSKPNNRYIPKIEVHTVRPAFRTGREGRQVEQVLVTLTQRIDANIADSGAAKRMVFRGGCSLILSLGKRNIVEYVVLKNIKSYDRFRRQAEYIKGEDANASAQSSSVYSDDDRDWRLDFNLLHRQGT
jgi:hypothetical protein